MDGGGKVVEVRKLTNLLLSFVVVSIIIFFLGFEKDQSRHDFEIIVKYIFSSKLQISSLWFDPDYDRGP